MREILFKAKRIDNGEWSEGWYCKYPFSRWPLNPCIIPSAEAQAGEHKHVEVDPSTVCQYTGLTDKNGKKIFEGDIVKFKDYKGDLQQKTIMWDAEYSRFCVWLDGATSCGVNKYLSNDIEVIGNMYE